MKTSATLTLALLLIGATAGTTFAQQNTSSASTGAASTGAASTGGTYKVTVVVSGISTRSGKLYVGLANNSETFMGQSYKQTMADVTPSGDISVTLEGVPAGRYAVRVYQDLNNNQKMDFSGQMPDEPFGFSNVTRLMGPPSFDQSSFELSGNQTVAVTMMQM